LYDPVKQVKLVFCGAALQKNNNIHLFGISAVL